MELGKNISLNNLLKEYDAIYLAIGANVPTEMKNTRRRTKMEFMEQILY